MTMNLFDQFATPQLLGMPLITLALLLPTMITHTTPNLLQNRLATAQAWLTNLMTKQLMLPINKPGHPWSLPLTTLLLLLLMLNLLGLLPYTFTPTTQLSMNTGLALPMWLMTVLVGLHNQPSHALAHMLPLGTPGPLVPILILIETVSLLIRPLALAVRLTANLTAGHLLMMLVSTASIALLNLSPTLSALTLILLLLLSTLEVAVAMIQAYVFVLLLSLYLQENT